MSFVISIIYLLCNIYFTYFIHMMGGHGDVHVNGIFQSQELFFGQTLVMFKSVLIVNFYKILQLT